MSSPEDDGVPEPTQPEAASPVPDQDQLVPRDSALGRSKGFRRKAMIIGALVFFVSGAAVLSTVSSGRDKLSGGQLTNRAVADATGRLAAEDSHYSVSASAGTFSPGATVRLGAAAAPVPSAGMGRFLTPPLQVDASEQPSRPVIIDSVELHEVDATLMVAVLWSPGAQRIELLPVEQLTDGRVRARAPHFSGFGFLIFQSPIDLSTWINDTVIDGLVDYVGDFFDAPYECPPAKFTSNLVDSQGYPKGSVNLQVDISDHPSQPDTITAAICNRLRFVMQYVATGAVAASGFSLPRSNLALDLHWEGQAKDPLTIDAAFTGEAVTATLAILAVEAASPSVGKNKVVEVVFNDATIAAIADSTRSCSSSVDAARASAAPDALLTAWACLKQLDRFVDVVIDLYTTRAIEQGLMGAGTSVPHVRAVLGGQALNRLVAEWWTFGLPEPVSFPYRLRCTTGDACPARGEEPKGVTAAQLREVGVPSLCNYPAGRLVDGRLPGTPSDGFVQLASVENERYAGPDVAVGDLDGDGVNEGVVVVSCNPAGSNTVLATVLAYRPGPTLIGTVPYGQGGPLPQAGFPPFAIGATIDGASIVVSAVAYEEQDAHCCPTVRVVERFSMAGSRFVRDTRARLGTTITADGIGPVRVGMSYLDASKAANLPVSVGTFDDGDVDEASCTSTSFIGAPGELYGLGGDGRIQSLVVTDRRYRTPEGVSVGSSEAEVDAAYGRRIRRLPNEYQEIEDIYIDARPDGSGKALRFELDESTRRVRTIHAGEQPAVSATEGCA